MSLSVSARAAPGDGVDACRAAFSAGPELAKNGHLVAASSQLTLCAAEPCPASMRAMCAEDLRRLEARMPSVVFAAKNAAGEDLVHVRVVEGEHVVAESLDGRSVAVDPGSHTFRFEAESGAAVVQALVREGERAREIVAQLRAPEPSLAATERTTAPRAEGARPVPWTAFVTGGLTLAATASAGYFGARGVSDRADLAACKGSCDHASVQRARTDFVAADVSLAVAATALVLTVVLYVTRPTVPREGARLAEGWLVHAF
jgi:hypothetical protein